MDSAKKILEVRDLKKYFPSGSQMVKAVDGVSFNLYKGETLGIVGESGCGKSTMGRLTLRLIDADYGSIKFKGTDIRQLDKSNMRQYRKSMQMIFQDPFSSLNPRKTIGESIERPMIVQNTLGKKSRFERTLYLMEKVGLNPNWVNKYPHELDGGRRQRVGIARALALEPEYIVCDEPVSALDVSVQSQVLNLLQDLQEEMQLTYLFISHNLAVVKHISDRIAVMYLGQIVEIATAKELFENPVHPYTKALLSAIPVPEIGTKKDTILLKGDVPSPKNLPQGCRFHTRCPYLREICKMREPEMKEIGNGHSVACYCFEQR